jgi:hypothetical protein
MSNALGMRGADRSMSARRDAQVVAGGLLRPAHDHWSLSLRFSPLGSIDSDAIAMMMRPPSRSTNIPIGKAANPVMRGPIDQAPLTVALEGAQEIS